jgi:hypothetical protein
MMHTEKIQPDPEALKARLNQRYVTRVEALKQFRLTMPLLPNAEREFQESELAAARDRNVSSSPRAPISITASA